MKSGKKLIQVVFCLLLVVIACSGGLAAEPSKEVPHADPAFTGPAPICPRWAFEPWIWEDNKNTQQAVLKVVQDYLDRDIPVGTIIIDSPWETSYNSFEWDRKRYPEPEKMIDELNSRGVRVVMWITGAMNRTSKDAPENKAPGHDEIIGKGWAVNNGSEYEWWKGKGVHVDFTSKAACDWFGTQMAPIVKMGIAGWKVDEGEQYLPDPVTTSIGVISKSVFKPYYYAAIADQSKKYNPESIVLTRPFSASVNKTTVVWGGDYPGDWKGLAGQVERLYSAAKAGYSAPCVEVGGFLGAAPTKESLIRYAQFGALMPVMNNGGSNGGLTNHLPWFHDEQTTTIYRYYAVLHSEISDYLFSCSVDAHLNGGSIVKSPDSDKAQHLLGDWMFVSSVIGPENSKDVVLPDTGLWIDYWNQNKLYAPKTEMKLDVPLSRSPVFIRAGAIIPMRVRNDITGHGDASSADKRTILVYPYERSSYLYHCNRTSGIEYDDIKLTMDEKAGILKVDGKKQVSYRFRIISFAAPKTVTGADSWSYDKMNKCIIVDKKGDAFSIQIEGLKSYSAVSVENRAGDSIPLPEHPRPDFQRNLWLNLNGQWDFQFDKENQGIEKRWFSGKTAFHEAITVPFSWGSKLSGVKDEADIGWYRRNIQIPESWKGNRVFLVIGACDWHTTAWLDGKKLGEHQGGYTPFEFDLSDFIEYGKKHDLVLRVDDTTHRFKLEGKQGYGRAAGIWQTTYLEARPGEAIETIHFSPDIDNKEVKVNVTLNRKASAKLDLQLQFKSADPVVARTIAKGEKQIAFTIPIREPHLWSLDDPYLYYISARLTGADGQTDEVATYFGMRKISVMNLPGTDIPYVALNNKPIYLQLTLDQAYHPDGYYTFPSDAFMRDEIRRTKSIGLNGQRIHVKIEIPRKLYWADRLGVLIMADVPNSWGDPDDDMRSETEYALRQMIKRDYNHPAIFSWVIFNETWGLRTRGKDKGNDYLPETQKWVEEIYHLAKQLDPTRLVEDNSTCDYDHVATDLNSWHNYLPGYLWRKKLDKFCQGTFQGSEWNFIGGRKQGNQPMLNSEFGNVWGYNDSTGDVDWSWDYHIMINEFRRHPRVCGWLYTEHHDVINEWNGYWRLDRSNKYTGMSDLTPGMQLNDLHGKFYLASERELCKAVAPNQKVEVPLWISAMTDENAGDTLRVDATLYGWDSMGNHETYWQGHSNISYQPWMQKELDPIQLTMPAKPALAVLSLLLKDAAGNVLHRNFTTYLIADKLSSRDEIVKVNGQKLRVLRFAPDAFDKAQWTLKQWNVLDGLKVNGAGSGFFEYRIPWPGDLKWEDVEYASLKMELSAKQLFGKDKGGTEKQDGNFMRGEGTYDPSLSRNSYPMTDDVKYPSIVRVRVSGQSVGDFELPDDSGDHRGILSWYSQRRDRELREAGSYGYLVTAYIPSDKLKESYQQKTIVVRLEVDDSIAGGLAVYGERFGRYPIDPSIIIKLKD